VRIVELSNHPESIRSAAEAARHARAASRQVQREAALRQVDELRGQRRQARGNGQWWRWLRLLFAVSRAKRGVPSRSIRESVLSDAEQKARSGMAGEKRVSDRLAAALGDEWVLFHGYQNGRGEIDHVLVGPRGVVAIEVKNVNATVDIDGDVWAAKKFDRYGNRVPARELTDRSGRSPSVQVNEGADALQEFLRKRGQQIHVRRVVLLTHDKSRIARQRNLTVDAVGTSAEKVLDLLNSMPPTIRAAQRATVETHIKKDHAFHENRRSARRGS
jgi:Nuclease-related domain